TLPVEQRAAIVLVDIEGYPVDEVAAMLEVPSGTVKSRCARGRAKLVPLLSHLRGEPDPGDQPGEQARNPTEADRVEPPMNPPREDLR
ncbi:MAG TPA: sigma factor-like helix-turn-helix DNA-binding protein, partial [Acidothermaceae bacterium]